MGQKERKGEERGKKKRVKGMGLRARGKEKSTNEKGCEEKGWRRIGEWDRATGKGNGACGKEKVKEAREND